MQADTKPYLDKALESLAGTESEFVNERYNNTANRAYYAVFHAAIAALQRAGIHPARDEWSHEFVPAQYDGVLINRRHVYPTELRGVWLPRVLRTSRPCSSSPSLTWKTGTR